MILQRKFGYDQAHYLVNNLRTAFNETKKKGIALTKLTDLYKQVEETGLKAFNTVEHNIKSNYRTISRPL